MPAPIEDDTLIGGTHTAGLVSRQGSIDWLCPPRFDGGGAVRLVDCMPPRQRYRG
jgi:hypothetical protein